MRLGAPCPGSTVGFLSTDLSGTDPALKSGFTVTLVADGGAQGTDCNNQAGVGGYYVTATPVNFGTSGNRSFASNTVGTIYFANAAAPPTLDQMVQGGGGTPLQ